MSVGHFKSEDVDDGRRGRVVGAGGRRHPVFDDSDADAALIAARRLTDGLDAEAQGWLENVVVVFVPTQNPDGRERFINSFEAGLGAQPNGDPLSAERAEPWPSGRFNHNLFDLNRDWFAQTQPETRGHAALQRQWKPQVVADIRVNGGPS